MPLRLADVPSLPGRRDIPLRAKAVRKTCLRGLRPQARCRLGREVSRMQIAPEPRTATVYVRRDCVRWGDRGPYHWTAECIEGRALVEVDRNRADAMPNLRPCRLCASRDRRRVQTTARRAEPAADQPFALTQPRTTLHGWW